MWPIYGEKRVKIKKRNGKRRGWGKVEDENGRGRKIEETRGRKIDEMRGKNEGGIREKKRKERGEEDEKKQKKALLCCIKRKGEGCRSGSKS